LEPVIGVYDSGYGGLTVLRALLATMPDRQFVFLGDNGRAPYGDREVGTLLDFAEQSVERLFEEGCSVIVVACHTVSCVALRHLQKKYNDEHRRVLGVTIPAAELAIASGKKKIGWFGTSRTVSSRTPATEILKLDRSATIQLVAAPLLAAIVEEALEGTEIARLAVEHYLTKLSEVDVIVLGCTHYPLLADHFRRLSAAGVEVLDPSPFVAQCLQRWLERHPDFDRLAAGEESRLRILSTGDPQAMAQHGARFLGQTLPRVEHIAEVGGRLAHRETPARVEGQVVRT
jgi:glutamate racemase